MDNDKASGLDPRAVEAEDNALVSYLRTRTVQLHIALLQATTELEQLRGEVGRLRDRVDAQPNATKKT